MLALNLKRMSTLDEMNKFANIKIEYKKLIGLDEIKRFSSV